MSTTATVTATIGSTSELRREGAAWHRRVEGLHVLKVAGSFHEMGRQHGVLLRDHIAGGPIPYFRTYVERMLGRSVLGKVGEKVVWPLLKQLIGRRVVKAIPEFAHEGIRGLSEGSGMPLKELLDGCSMPDSFMWAAARALKMQKVGPAVHHRIALGLGCTSAIAWGGATADGKLLHARNLDYHCVESWPREQAVIFHDPESGQRYVSVAAAGVLMGGVTAMNEAGLSLTVHQHMFTTTTRLGGTPIGLVGDIIMREATNLDEAQAILAAHKPIGCWTYLVTDGKNREMLCWEESPDRSVAMRRSGQDGTFGYANIYLDPELGATEVAGYGSYWRANRGRHERVNGLLREQAGSLDANAMAAIIGDIGDTGCRLRAPIAMLMTVGSVVFRPEDGTLWVATGQAPTSQRKFVPFSLHDEDHAAEVTPLTASVRDADDAAAQAFDLYREAYLAYFEGDDLTESRRLLERIRGIQPEQTLYHKAAGLLAIADGAAEQAHDAFSRAVELGHVDPERRAALLLWRGRAADLLGRRDEAIADYEASLSVEAADAPVRDAARAGVRRAYRPRQARRTSIDFAYADVVRP